MTPNRLVNALALALVLTATVACDLGSRLQPRAPGEPAPQIVVATESNEEPLATCGGVAFPAAVLDAPPAPERPEVEAIRSFLAGGSELHIPGGAEWRFAVENAGRATFLTKVGGEWFYATVEAAGDGWRTVNMGDCQLHAAVSELVGASPWWLDERLPPPTGDATELHVLVQERECASGSYATGRIGSPVAAYSAGEVVITVGIRAVGGTCPSNPSTPAVIVLKEPLGERQLLDGFHIPPAQPREPDLPPAQPRGSD